MPASERLLPSASQRSKVATGRSQLLPSVIYPAFSLKQLKIMQDDGSPLAQIGASGGSLSLLSCNKTDLGSLRTQLLE